MTTSGLRWVSGGACYHPARVDQPQEPRRPRVVVVVLTFDAERHVDACLGSLARLDAPGRVAFWLTDDLAPGPGEAIVLDVAHDGAVTLTGDRGRDKARADVLAARLRDMRLPPGRYRLTRADQ